MAVTIKDVAKAAGVSTASISRAFQDPPSPYLSEERRKFIRKLCDEMHYFPNIHSRRMSQKFANTIVLISRMMQENHSGGGFFQCDLNWGMTAQGIMSALCAAGKSLQIINCDERFIKEEKYLEVIRSHTADGILIWGALREDEYISKMQQENIPFVQLETFIDGLENNCVLADEYTGFQKIVERVISAGHRNIAVIAPSLKASTGVTRFSAVMETLEKHRITPVWVSENGSFEGNYGISCAGSILKEAPQTTCVIAPNDAVAWNCINVFREKNLRVPQDISVTGADGLQIPGELQLESFYLPSWEIGNTAASELCSLLYGTKTTEIFRVIPTIPIHGNSIAEVTK